MRPRDFAYDPFSRGNASAERGEVLRVIRCQMATLVPLRLRLKAKLLRLLRPKDSEKQALAEAEINEVDNVLEAIFSASQRVLMADPLYKKMMGSQVVDYSHIDVSGLFLYGVVTAFLECRPSLPTLPWNRALLHLTFYYHKTGTDWEDARNRVNNVDRQYNSALPLADRIIEFGKLAYADGSDQHLVEAHKAAYIASLP